jgi:hypothetical protein
VCISAALFTKISIDLVFEIISFAAILTSSLLLKSNFIILILFLFFFSISFVNSINSASGALTQALILAPFS